VIRNKYCSLVSYGKWGFNGYLIGSVNCRGTLISMEEIFGLWKSDQYIEALYSGYESSGEACDPAAALKVVEMVNKILLL
jgi:hypothetical protein